MEPLALFILENPKFSGNFDEKLTEFINEELGVANKEEALQGAKDIIAEMINENAEVRKAVREYSYWNYLLLNLKRQKRKLHPKK